MNLLCCCYQMMAPNTRVTKKWELFAGRNRFYCNGLLMSAPHTGVFYLTCFLITGTSTLFFIFDCPYLATRISPAIPIVGALLYFFTMSSLLRTTFTDPGIIPRASHDEAAYIEKQIEVPNSLNSPTYRPPPRTKEVLVKGQVVKLKYCFTCKIFRPPRASHCSLCDNCVDRFDHHCPWVGNCVGKRNYRFFYMFLVSLAFLAVFIFSCSITHIVLLVKVEQEAIDVLKKAPFSVVVTVICFFSIWSVIGLAGFHTYLTTSNQTTNEDLKGSFSSKSGHRAINPYSHGNICLNCVHILCGPMTPSLIDRRGVATDEYISQMQQHSGSNQLTEVITTQQTGMIIHQPMITTSLAGDMKQRLYDESNPTIGMYRHRSYDNLQNGNSNSLAHLVENEIPLSTLDGTTAATTPTTSTISPISPIIVGSSTQMMLDDDDIDTTTNKNVHNLSGSYNNLFRDNLDNSFAEHLDDGVVDNVGDDDDNDNNDDDDSINGISIKNDQLDLTRITQSATIHEFQQQQQHLNISDDNLTLSKRLQKSTSESENVYSNIPTSTTNLIKAHLKPSSIIVHPTNLMQSTINSDDSNKSDPSLHVYSNLIEEQQQQQQQHQYQQQFKQSNPNNYEKKQSHLQIELSNPLIQPLEITKHSTIKTTNTNCKRNSKHDDLIISADDDPTNLMSSTLLSDDLDLDDPVSAFVVNNRKYSNNRNSSSNPKSSSSSSTQMMISQNRKSAGDCDTEFKSNQLSGGANGISLSSTLHHHHHHSNNNNSNISNNLVKDSNVTSSRLKLLHDTTMIDTALDLDSLDGSSLSQSCMPKTALV